MIKMPKLSEVTFLPTLDKGRRLSKYLGSTVQELENEGFYINEPRGKINTPTGSYKIVDDGLTEALDGEEVNVFVLGPVNGAREGVVIHLTLETINEKHNIYKVGVLESITAKPDKYKGSSPKAKELYEFLILKLGITLATDSQSPGGYAVWRQIGKHKDIEIYGWKSETNELVNVGTDDQELTHVSTKEMIAIGDIISRIREGIAKAEKKISKLELDIKQIRASESPRKDKMIDAREKKILEFESWVDRAQKEVEQLTKDRDDADKTQDMFLIATRKSDLNEVVYHPSDVRSSWMQFWLMGDEIDPNSRGLKKYGKLDDYTVYIRPGESGDDGIEFWVLNHENRLSLLVDGELNYDENKLFSIGTLEADREISPGAVKFYSWLILKKGLSLSTDQQTTGGLKVWQRLAKMPGIAIYLMDRKNDKSIKVDLEDISKTHVSTELLYDILKKSKAEKDPQKESQLMDLYDQLAAIQVMDLVATKDNGKPPFNLTKFIQRIKNKLFSKA